jgi:hypothetical protein
MEHEPPELAMDALGYVIEDLGPERLNHQLWWAVDYECQKREQGVCNRELTTACSSRNESAQ